ncbi:antibiotic biosynthesis monooxygenase [Poseidonocella sp. HB161398]|uniref:antibiotic biosynthesis monooxygenase family protein n=1 Tax=Poseidonocella sp. HB161398 TaxID=2320855 RepID=UPI001107C093|nr:antibiotic biosynthesis monooxygenase [Poseidonocella sp. HB161398]
MTRPGTATITAAAAPLALVNVYEVDPAQQAALCALLSEQTEAVLRHVPGFVSASYHASLDGTKVVNYAQWRGQEEFAAFMADPDNRAQLARFAALARSVSPVLCRVTAVHAAPAG